ncbi:MAG: hypothetical protein FWB95_05750 [Treponema sp.]|nr:hypothetical protein [Treponema sp.]
MIVKFDTQKSNINLSVKTPRSESTVKTSASAPSDIPRSAVKLASAAGLPAADKLSASIISFARFFSLPLKPQVLADIRRQVFLQPAPLAQSAAQPVSQTAAAPNNSSANASLANQSAAEKIRETLSLSATAAESKGTELTAKGLETYADAVNPDSRRQDGERQRRERNKNEQDDKSLSKSGEITAQDVKEKAFEYMEHNPLLEILNRLPAKNGQRWIVLPFDFTDGDKEYFVSMRVLLEEDHAKRRKVHFMVLDIVISDESRKIFIFKLANEKPERLFVYHSPELPQKEHRKVKQELAKQFDMPTERVFIKTSEESFPFESGFGEDRPSIDEAV